MSVTQQEKVSMRVKLSVYLVFFSFNHDLCSSPQASSLISYRFSEVGASTAWFVSHTVTKFERNYTQSKKEALAVVTAVMKLPK